MTKHRDGGPAFPYGQPNVTERFSEGMSLRDYFAAAALATEWMGDYSIYEQADLAYNVADAMLAERAKRKEVQP